MYDLIILGAGPAGLTAALFAARYRLKTVVIGKEIGGQANYASVVENYPGIKSISGADLIKIMKSQVTSLGVKIIEENITNVTKVKEKQIFSVITEKNSYQAKAIIFALGTERKKLNLPEEEKFLGKGISYCATCDAPLFRNKSVAVVGGSDSAVMSAMLLSKYAKKVYIIYRGKELRAEPIKVEQLKKTRNIEIIYNAEVQKISGKNFVEKILLTNKKTLEAQGIFVEIGSTPSTYLIQKLGLETDNQGYIITNNAMETNIPGLFAAGDCISKKLRQIINAAGEGATAAFSAYAYLKSKKNS
ncbi:MAG: thioredoxin-disulfide reductase [Candidatus Pacearchaeota archaeon]|nr:thioredoxin-disulfide reductase [Candidatus Pacearchaeota archaeon]